MRRTKEHLLLSMAVIHRLSSNWENDGAVQVGKGFYEWGNKGLRSSVTGA